MTYGRLSLHQRLGAFCWRADEFGRMQDMSGVYADAGLLAELGAGTGCAGSRCRSPCSSHGAGRHALPIILSASGDLFDGAHRVAQAWVAGHVTVRAVQFAVDPEPDWIERTLNER